LLLTKRVWALFGLDFCLSPTKQFAGDACKAASFEIAWFSNSQKLLFARSCDGFTSDTSDSQSLYTSDTSGIKGTKLVRNLEVGGEPHKTGTSSKFYLSPSGQQVAIIKEKISTK
jgi:hypothetical protein